MLEWILPIHSNHWNSIMLECSHIQQLSDHQWHCTKSNMLDMCNWIGQYIRHMCTMSCQLYMYVRHISMQCMFSQLFLCSCHRINCSQLYWVFHWMFIMSISHINYMHWMSIRLFLHCKHNSNRNMY